MNGSVVLYRRTDGLLYVSGFSRNKEGWQILNGWYRSVAAEASDDGSLAIGPLRTQSTAKTVSD